MGIRHFVFAVNKMDLVKYDQETFRKIEEQIKGLQEELSLQIKIIQYPQQKDNVTTKSDNIPWYTGELLEYLELLMFARNPKKKDSTCQFREYAVQTTHSVDSGTD